MAVNPTRSEAVPPASSASVVEVAGFSWYSARPELAGDHADVLRLYWAFFGRQPDVAGARYWVGLYDDCVSLIDITQWFADSPEFTNRYGSLSDDDYVDLVYSNVLGRAPDDKGRRYWVDLLATGQTTRPEVMLYFSLGKEFRNQRPLPSDGRPYVGCHTAGDPLPVVEAGTYVVGGDVSPGVYRVIQYWATLDANEEILNNEFVLDNGLALAVIPAGARLVKFSGEAVAVNHTASLDPIAAGYTDGTYLVGNDIEPGRYRVSNPGELAYGARLDATLDIIANDLNENSIILTIQPTDYAFTFSGTLQRID